MSSSLLREADRLLFDEAKARFDFEQKLAVALQAKSAFFLTLAAAFAGLVATAVWKVSDKPALSPFDYWALGLLGLSLLLLSACILVLVRSSLTLDYQVAALPSQWKQHLTALRQANDRAQMTEDEVSARLRLDLTDAWVEAAEAGHVSNAFKARLLAITSRMLSTTITIAIFGLLLQVLPRFFT